MHALRKNLLARMVVCTLLVLAALSWASLAIQDEAAPPAPPPAPPLGYSPPPPAQEQALLAEAVRLLTAPAQGGAAWQGVDQTLLAERTKSAEEPSVALVFMGNGKRYAAIDGEMYTLGDLLPDGREVAAINATGVGLNSQGQRSVLPWSKPKDTVLARQKFATTAAGAKPQNQTSGQAAPGTAPAAGSLSTEQAMQLVKQLNEQQQSGKKP